MSDIQTRREVIQSPGVYEMTDAEYQTDPCDEISLRSSTAWKLVDEKNPVPPAKVWWQTPRLNPQFVPEQKRYFDLGAACHALLLGKGRGIYRIKGFADYRKDAAKAERDAAYERGETPLLEHEYEQACEMAARARAQFAMLVDDGQIEEIPFQFTQTERVAIWRDPATGVLCRAMFDGLPDSLEYLDEYKTEGQIADGRVWQWKARRMGYVFRLAFYRRGLEALKLAYSPALRFFVQETEPPYLVNLVTVADEMLAAENERVAKALKIWRKCLEENRWPGYEPFEMQMTERERMGDTLAQVNNPASPYYHLSSEDIS